MLIQLLRFMEEQNNRGAMYQHKMEQRENGGATVIGCATARGNKSQRSGDRVSVGVKKISNENGRNHEVMVQEAADLVPRAN